MPYTSRPGDLGVLLRGRSSGEPAKISLAEDSFDREALALAEESAGVGVWSIDLATGRIRATAQFFRNLGLEPTSDSVPVEIVRALRHPEDAERAIAGFRQALERGDDAYEVEYRIVRPDGNQRWIFGRGRVIRSAEGTPLRFSGLDLDITDRKATEQALSDARHELERMNRELEQRVRDRTADLEREAARRVEAESQLHQIQRMEAVGQLSGGIAHDFNNILQVIMGNLEIVRLASSAPRIDPRNAEHDVTIGRALATAQRAAMTARDLVQQLLAFGRRQSLIPASLDANALVVDMTGIIERALGATITVSTDLAAQPWPAFADRNRLQGVLLNLVVNARDAMPGGGRLLIQTRNVEHPPDDLARGRYVSVRVTDTGCGIPAEHRHRVFEPFFTTKDASRGSGLGLSMAYGFAKQSGGHLALESEQGLGTTVTIYLPCAPNDPAPGASQHVHEALPLTQARPGEVVLFVEDDVDVRRLGVSALEALGYRVFAAADAHTALHVAESRECARIDLLFTDVVLPGGINGIELAETMRGRRPALPVLFTSGFTPERMRIHATERALYKPYSLEDLAVQCREAIDLAVGRV